jgi:HlyD family secretion protein
MKRLMFPKIFVASGDAVKKGTLIAKIKIIPDMITLNNAEARPKKARLNLKGTPREGERRKTLFKKGIIAEYEFLQFELAYSNAREELEAAENNLNLIREGVALKYADTTNTLILSIGAIEGEKFDSSLEYIAPKGVEEKGAIQFEIKVWNNPLKK